MNPIAKKELLRHLVVVFFIFLLISLFRRWLSISHYPFWIGGLFGIFLPDVDHFIYVYLRPHEVTSQRVASMVQRKEIKNTYALVAETKEERSNLILHTSVFQLIFLALTFLILTSSGNFFGRGLVLAFSFKLLLEQHDEYKKRGNLNSWFINFPFEVAVEKHIVYWTLLLVLNLIFGFLF